MKQNRGIRCLKCGKLVSKDYHNSNYEEYAMVKLNVNGIKGCICSSCVELYKQYNFLNKSLNNYFDLAKQTVFGQDEAVEKVVYSVYLNQYINMLESLGFSFKSNVYGGSDQFKRRHILLIGDTGVGKTLLATTVAKMFNVPYSISNATPLTSSGYVGEDVEKILERLYQAANNNMERAENGIIILDEIDKKRHEPNTLGKDVSGKSVQQELLKILEPSTVWIKNHSLPFKTDNLTVIMMGAFVGLDEIINRRTKKHQIGFTNNLSVDDESDMEVKLEDLIEYGFIPEFVGRLLGMCRLNKLDANIMKKVINSAIEKYKLIFNTRNFELSVSEQFIQNLAEDIVKSPTGARNVEFRLNNIIMPALTKVLQTSTSGKCEILADGLLKITYYNKKKSSKAEIISY